MCVVLVAMCVDVWRMCVDMHDLVACNFGNRSETRGFYHVDFRPVPFLHLNPQWSLARRTTAEDHQRKRDAVKSFIFTENGKNSGAY